MPRTARIKGIAKTIAYEVDTQDDEDDEKAGKDPHPPGTANQEGLRLLHHVAPGGGWLLNAESKE